LDEVRRQNGNPYRKRESTSKKELGREFTVQE
jgi:hypothetical protein